MAQHRQAGHYDTSAFSHKFQFGVRPLNYHQQKQSRARRQIISFKCCGRFFIVASITILCVVISMSSLAHDYVSKDRQENKNRHVLDYDMKKNLDFFANITQMEMDGNHGARHSKYELREENAVNHALGGQDEGLLKEANVHEELKKFEAEYKARIESNPFLKVELERERNVSHAVANGYIDAIDASDLQAGDYHAVKHADGADHKMNRDEVSVYAPPKANVQGGQKGLRKASISHIRFHPDSKNKPKRRKFSSSACQMKLLNSVSQPAIPFGSPKFVNFSTRYAETEVESLAQEWGPRFAGHQSLHERESSFLARDQTIHCGFIGGPNGGQRASFDLAEDDRRYMNSCKIVVSSCIFGNSDHLRSPTSKMITRLSKKTVCFVMFMDQDSLRALVTEGKMPDESGFVGLWKIVVVNNLPYSDMRRVGKIPKLLPHRLFPSARYSIWLDSKLRLQVDPLLILEYFLWRRGYEYAISNHYDRHCIWEEVAQNKRLNKYDHSMIDRQFAFYQSDGLKRFNASDPNRLLPSNVPEGSLIIRAHTPMSNLFSCLWFNEVDRFTPRDQLSFAYTYQKLRWMNPDKPFYLNMFKDCERRAVVKLFHHRAEELRTIASDQAKA